MYLGLGILAFVCFPIGRYSAYSNSLASRLELGLCACAGLGIKNIVLYLGIWGGVPHFMHRRGHHPIRDLHLPQIQHSIDEKDPVPLAIHHFPLAVTFALFTDGYVTDARVSGFLFPRTSLDEKKMRILN